MKFDMGPPTAAVVAPGECIFGEEWLTAPLLERKSIAHDTRILSFGLPDEQKPLGLSTCACILARGGKDEEGNPVVRPYTPISTNAMIGKMDLMVKVYPKGKMSQHMDTMKIGETLEFKHIKFNVKLQYPFKKAHIGMLVGGTGITPMIQALHAVLGTSTDTTKVSILYGSRTTNDILAREVLDEWVAMFPDRLTVTHVLSEEPKDSQWDGARGFINADLIKQHFAAPADDGLVLVCGPPPMYKALCGARDEKELTGVLADVGYKAENVFKF